MIIKTPASESHNITIGQQVEAAFRLFDCLPFMVRQDLSKLIFLYMHNPERYQEEKLKTLGPA